MLHETRNDSLLSSWPLAIPASQGEAYPAYNSSFLDLQQPSGTTLRKWPPYSTTQMGIASLESQGAAPNLVVPEDDFAQWFSRTFPGFIVDNPSVPSIWQAQDVAPSVPQEEVQRVETFVYGPTSMLAAAEHGPPSQIRQARHDLPNQKSYGPDQGGYGSQTGPEAPFGVRSTVWSDGNSLPYIPTANGR